MVNNNITTTDNNITGDYIILILTCLIFIVPTLLMVLSICEYWYSSHPALSRNNISAIAE